MRYRLDPAGKKRVTVIEGDGIGPEVVRATRQIIDATGVKIAWETREAGAEVFRRGLASGVPVETVDSIRETRVALKGPLETPVGFGEKSANVTLRKLFETYANVRPVREMPNVKTRYSGAGIDMVIVRENVEDLYAGIEHVQTPGVAQCLKLMSRKGCEKIVRVAFELARAEGRKTVHCATKANIMKFTEGLLKKTFEEIAPEYPDLEANHIIIDNCAHQLVRTPSLDALAEGTPMRLKMISNRGTKVYSDNGAMTDCVDHWRCRFVLRDAKADLDDATLFAVLGKVAGTHRWMHLEKLQEFDGAPAYSRAQGED